MVLPVGLGVGVRIGVGIRSPESHRSTLGGGSDANPFAQSEGTVGSRPSRRKLAFFFFLSGVQFSLTWPESHAHP